MSWSYIGTMVFVYEISDLSWICSYWNISFGLKNLDFAGKSLRRYKTHHIFSWYCRILGVGVKSRERRFVLAALVVWVVALANIVTLCFFGRLLSIMWKLLEVRGPLEKWTLKLINYENFQYLYSNHRHNLKFSQWPSFSSKCSWVTDFKLQPPSVHTPARQHCPQGKVKQEALHDELFRNLHPYSLFFTFSILSFAFSSVSFAVTLIVFSVNSFVGLLPLVVVEVKDSWWLDTGFSGSWMFGCCRFCNASAGIAGTSTDFPQL